MLTSLAKPSELQVGVRILSFRGESDLDGEDERETGPNAIGVIRYIYPGVDECFGVEFSNGTSVLLTAEELTDPALYRILESEEKSS